MSAVDQMLHERNLALFSTCLGEISRLKTKKDIEYEGLIHSIDPENYSYIILQHPRIISPKTGSPTHLNQKYCKFTLSEIVYLQIFNVNIFNAIKGQNSMYLLLRLSNRY